MIAKTAAVIAIAMASIGAAPAPKSPVDYTSIKLIMCGSASGTAWQVSPDTMITAAHVTSRGACFVDGMPVETIHQDGKLDIAAVKRRSFVHLKISCAGARKDKTYYAVGYAMGRYRMDSRIIAMGEKIAEGTDFDGLEKFSGGSIPGMSGGPIFDSSGRVIGLVTAGNPYANVAAGRLLSEVWLCAK